MLPISPSNSSDAGLRPGTGILSDKDPTVFKRDLMILTPAFTRRLDDAVAGVGNLVGSVDKGAICVDEGAACVSEGVLVACVDKGAVFVDKGIACADKEVAFVDKEVVCVDKEVPFADKGTACVDIPSLAWAF